MGGGARRRPEAEILSVFAAILLCISSHLCSGEVWNSVLQDYRTLLLKEILHQSERHFLNNKSALQCLLSSWSKHFKLRIIKNVKVFMKMRLLYILYCPPTPATWRQGPFNPLAILHVPIYRSPPPHCPKTFQPNFMLTQTWQMHGISGNFVKWENSYLIFFWQFKLATWLRVYNYVKNKHVRAETVAYLEVVSNK